MSVCLYLVFVFTHSLSNYLTQIRMIDLLLSCSFVIFIPLSHSDHHHYFFSFGCQVRNESVQFVCTAIVLSQLLLSVIYSVRSPVIIHRSGSVCPVIHVVIIQVIQSIISVSAQCSIFIHSSAVLLVLVSLRTNTISVCFSLSVISLSFQQIQVQFF